MRLLLTIAALALLTGPAMGNHMSNDPGSMTGYSQPYTPNESNDVGRYVWDCGCYEGSRTFYDWLNQGSPGTGGEPDTRNPDSPDYQSDNGR